jgi:DNA-binding transcriptional regulator YiaG
MTLAFRNVDVDPDEPVETWPFEGIRTALDRGGLAHWRRLAAAVRVDPWGPVARAVETAVALDRPYGVTALMETVVADARAAATAEERAVVAARVRALVDASGLTRSAFAERIGTSASRLSTYTTGSVIPSAALMVRMERVVGSSDVGATM